MPTLDQLHKIMPNAGARLNKYFPHLQQAMQEFEINTPLREAAFLAQLAHESGGLRYMEEIWGPTEAQRGYEGRSDLGNNMPGDGSRFRGRGAIQLTGRANYKKYGDLLGIDLTSYPERAASPEVGFRIAGAYWKLHNLNRAADAQDFRAITKKINGGYNGLEDRVKYYERAKKVLSKPAAVIFVAEPQTAPEPVSAEDAAQPPDTSTLAAPKPDNPTPQNITLQPTVAGNATQKKSLWATIWAAPALIGTWALTNIERVFGWVTGIKMPTIDPQTQRIVLISVAVIIGLFILRQIIGKVISEVGAIVITLRSMQYHADPGTNNVKIASPAPTEDSP